MYYDPATLGMRIRIPAFGMALSAVVFAVLAIACGSDSGARQPDPTAPNRAFASNDSTQEFLEPCVEDGYCRVFAVGGRLLTAAWLDDERMYLTDTQGRIRLLNVDTGDIETVLEGLTIPQGLTVLDGRLYVSDLGNVCQLLQELSGDEQDSTCKRWPSGAVTEFYTRASARILSYAVDDSGELGDRQLVADKILAIDVEHSPNGMTNDGEYVYVSIGYPAWSVQSREYFAAHAEELAAHRRRTDLMGVIARFRPPDGELEVYASGLRNTYGISFAADGTIYGADNDQLIYGEESTSPEGDTHLEELNAIVEGGFYGYPYWGTNQAPPEEQVIEPVAVIQGSGSTYAHANPDGVYVASWFGRYDPVKESGYVFVVDLFDYATWTPERIFRSTAYITSILERKGMLYLATLSGNVHVIDPSVATLPIYATPGGPFRNNDYVSQVISSASPIAQSGYDVYLDEGRLLYAKSSCSEADRTTWFFLHVVPVDPSDLAEGSASAEHGFNNLDFTFITGQGWRSGQSCFVVVELPEYQIQEIETGQTMLGEDDYTNRWKVEYQFEQ